ncbi:hypothetical protein ACFPRL_10450 [Pseudoclavibacter helvolus]
MITSPRASSVNWASCAALVSACLRGDASPRWVITRRVPSAGWFDSSAEPEARLPTIWRAKGGRSAVSSMRFANAGSASPGRTPSKITPSQVLWSTRSAPASVSSTWSSCTT